MLTRWREDLKIVFPKIVAGHKADLDLAFADAGVVTDFYKEQERNVTSTERSVRDSTKKKRADTPSDESKKKVRV